MRAACSVGEHRRSRRDNRRAEASVFSRHEPEAEAECRVPTRPAEAGTRRAILSGPADAGHYARTQAQPSVTRRDAAFGDGRL